MSKIEVKVADGQIRLNGRPELLRMRTSFKWLGWLWRDNEGQARRWLERCKDLGFHGVRVLGEHHFWGGPFYGIEPLMKPWNLQQHGGSSFRMNPKHQEVLVKAIDLLVEYDHGVCGHRNHQGDGRRGPKKDGRCRRVEQPCDACNCGVPTQDQGDKHSP
jgi:hypothetical protein